jgi:hypothetical protein
MIDVFPILDNPCSLLKFPTDILMFTQFSDLPIGKGVEVADEVFGGRIRSAKREVGNSFTGVLGQQMVVDLKAMDGPQYILLCGLGPVKLFDKTQLYKAVAVATDTGVAALNCYRMAIPVAHVGSTGLSFVDICEVIALVQDNCDEEFLIDVICTEANSRLLTGPAFNISNEVVW